MSLNVTDRHNQLMTWVTAGDVDVTQFATNDDAVESLALDTRPKDRTEVVAQPVCADSVRRPCHPWRPDRRAGNRWH